jgi:hypothetical protein
VIPHEDEAPRDMSAERRARRAWLGDAALLRRAEAAEELLGALEAQLAEREIELRRVKQREHAEQRLRVEAEEAVARLRRSHHAALERLQRRAEEAHAQARQAEEQRDRLAARLAEAGEISARLQQSVAALQELAVGMRTTLEHDHRAALARIRELEACVASTVAPTIDPALATHPAPADGLLPATSLAPADGLAADAGPALAAVAAAPPHREEMSEALANAAQRLRARVVAPPPEAPEPAPTVPEIPTVYVVPRLFGAPATAGRGDLSRRLAPAARRLARRLATWADSAQQRSQ